jgi:SAM-dependent methyltransferase
MDFFDLARLAGGHIDARIIQTAVQLGLFESLKDKPLDRSAVAARLQTDPRATELLLDALSALGLLFKDGAARFALTPASSTFLLRESTQYFGDMIDFDASLWNCWGRLTEAVRTGKPVRPANMYQDDPGETERFIRAMDSLVKARGDAAFLAQHYDWNNVRSLLDIGSGPGTYPIHLCRQYENLRAVIFDLPGTLKVTEHLVRKAGLTDRITLIPGDYRTDPLPQSFQLILLSNIIHAESYDLNQRLIGKLYGSLEQGGRIVIKDHILDPSRTAPPAGATFALLMLLTTGLGRCYTFDEVRSWLQEAGFTNIAETPLPPPFTSSLVTGRK